MALLQQSQYPLSLHSPRYPYLFPNPYYHSFLIIPATSTKPLLRFDAAIAFSGHRSLPHRSLASPTAFAADRQVRPETVPLKAFARVAVSAVLFLCLGVRLCLASSPPAALPAGQPVLEEQTVQDDHDGRKQDDKETVVDKELEEAFNAWKSKTFALTVPLKVVALRGSIPPSWIKDFINSQGRRMKFNVKYYASLESIFSDLSIPFTKGKIGPASALAADIVGIGDSWLKFAINKAIIEPIRDIEDQEWFKSLDDKWKVYLRRNCEGEIDPEGDIWAVPYRWGCMVIAYKTNKFQKHKLAPVEDWADLWRPDLAGRISMVDSPREVVGAVLKYMGASYNTNDINAEFNGGRDAVKHNLSLLAKQVRLFDSSNYLKAFGVGDVWVAVGWSSDIIPAAKRMSNVTVVVPKSGASLWADLWAIPAASRIQTNRIGGRIRGPSPLIYQWIEFCLQSARALPFKQEVIPGASPSHLQGHSANVPVESTKGRPRLNGNLVDGAPPPDILERCEFLEPLSNSTLQDYHWLLTSIQEPGHGLIHKMYQYYILSVVKFSGWFNSKLT
ncbi:Spermidine-binding periplasmic protein SpuE [Spatholobus suberectus]|nr:Spermidine-binding periplasmic protein SpuE [Spatholobus suberectus]